MTDAPIGIDPTPLNSRAAGVVIFYGDLVLLCKRITSYQGVPTTFPGHWAPFTGSIDEGESPIACAARELKEESGKEVSLHHLTYIEEIPGDNGSLVLYAHEEGDLFVPCLNFEHTEHGYFKIDSLDSSPSPMCPKVVRAVQGFHRDRRHAW